MLSISQGTLAINKHVLYYKYTINLIFAKIKKLKYIFFEFL